MSCLNKCLTVISAAIIIASAQCFNHSHVFPQEICLLRSHAGIMNTLVTATGKSKMPESELTIVTELDRVIQETYDILRMGEAEILQRRTVLSDLLKRLPRINLTVEASGSCCNGFGLVTSDLDVQLTGNITRKEIMQLLLTTEFSVVEISKRMPLIVLRHYPTDLRVDVTVNPTDRDNMGQFMWVLRKFSSLDARAQVLGVFLKAVVNMLKISETKFGDVGSSTYVIMLIHYLQQTNPPVLPGIPQMENKAERFLARNNATVGQLWLGFLRYYVHEFNYEENVICLYHVRCKTRKEKGWNGPDHNMISIEAPTNEETDAGIRLAPFMSDYTLRVFNQLQSLYLKDNYDGLLRGNEINLDYHPRYGHKRDFLVDTWGHYNRTTCKVIYGA